jgi:hypothetical protein
MAIALIYRIFANIGLRILWRFRFYDHGPETRFGRSSPPAKNGIPPLEILPIFWADQAE